MTIKTTFATAVAVSSAVLFFSQSAQAMAMPLPPQPPQMPAAPQFVMPQAPAPVFGQPLLPQIHPTAPVISQPAGQPAAKPAAKTPNTYTKGQCTWYAKDKRSDIPNGLGNANTWYSRAAAKGFSEGTSPRANAIGTTTAGTYGHVVYVEKVNSNGTIYISEMNFNGQVGKIHYRTVKASTFKYIY